MSLPSFDPDGPKYQYAIAASFDVTGFSQFCLNPNTHAFLAGYVSRVFEFLEFCFEQMYEVGGKKKPLVQPVQPTFSKYTGDGALLLWVSDSAAAFTSHDCTCIVLALRRFQKELPGKIGAWEIEWHASGMPRKIRVGIAAGPVQPLTQKVTTLSSKTVDYAGYCINLAVRLQDHCPDVGFIIDQRVQPQLGGLLLSLRALKMKGSLDENVYVFADDLLGLPKKEGLLASLKLTPAEEAR